MSPQVALLPRPHPEFHAAQAARGKGAPHSNPIDLPASSEAIAYVVCNNAAQIRELTTFLSLHSIAVNAFTTATEYITKAKSNRIACVILDLNLPDINGLEVQSRLSGGEGPPVIFVTAHGDLKSGVRAMKNGAIDFMIEPFDYNRLLAAVEAGFAQDRRKRLERVERSCLLQRWNLLTPREKDVFQFTVAGFLNKQSAAELGITENTFQVHRGRVMRKMEADSLADLVRMAIRLESLILSGGKNESTTQSLKAILQGQIGGSSKGSYPLRMIEIHHHGTNTVSTSKVDRFGNLLYAEDRRD